MNRRSLLTLTMGTVAAQALPAPITRAQMVSSAWYPGVSPVGDLKYPSGFKQFDYVNAKAPRGGAARQIAHKPRCNCVGREKRLTQIGLADRVATLGTRCRPANVRFSSRVVLSQIGTSD